MRDGNYHRALLPKRKNEKQENTYRHKTTKKQRQIQCIEHPHLPPQTHPFSATHSAPQNNKETHREDRRSFTKTGRREERQDDKKRDKTTRRETEQVAHPMLSYIVCMEFEDGLVMSAGEATHSPWHRHQQDGHRTRQERQPAEIGCVLVEVHILPRSSTPSRWTLTASGDAGQQGVSSLPPIHIYTER